MLGQVTGEYGIVTDPEITFSGSGNAKLKLRLISKKRKKDDKGNWADGEAVFRNAVVWGKLGENLCDSVQKGDSIVIIGEDMSYEYEKDGEKKHYDYIDIKSVGVSVRWQPVKSVMATAVEAVEETLGASPF